MSEMVERVARAICTAREQNGGPPWEHWECQPGGKHVLNAFRDDARAAIEAMREPTDAMREAGEKAAEPISYHMTPFHCAGVSFSAMIDEALK